MANKPEPSMYVNGDLFLRADTRREPPVLSEEGAHAQFIADCGEALLRAHDANTNTPMDPSIAATAADWIWWRFIAMRPGQFDAYIDIVARADRFDASAVSMITGVGVSDVKNAHRRVKKIMDLEAAAAEEATKAAEAADPVAAATTA